MVAKKLLLFKAFLKKSSSSFAIFRQQYWRHAHDFCYVSSAFGSYRGLVGVAIMGIQWNSWSSVAYCGFCVSLRIRMWPIHYGARQEGTLEQLYMSVHGFGWVMGAKAAAGFFINSILVVILLRAVMAVTGSTLNIDLLSIIPITIFTLIGILGIGFTVGGLTLVFKRIESFTQMIQFALAASSCYRFTECLVGTTAAGQLWSIIGQACYDWRYPPFRSWVLGMCFLHSNQFRSFRIRIRIYRLCERRAMSEGLLGHY